MKSGKMKEYAVIVALGVGSFLTGYLISQYVYGEICDHLSCPASLVLIHTVGFFVGVFPLTLYLERTHKSILKAALITLGLVGSWFITLKLWPIVNATLMEHIGIFWFHAREFPPIISIFSDPALLVYNGLWSISFGGLVLLSRRIKRKDTLLVAVFLFLVLIFSMKVPSYFIVTDAEYQILQRSIFGGLFSILVKRFFIADRINKRKS